MPGRMWRRLASSSGGKASQPGLAGTGRSSVRRQYSYVANFARSPADTLQERFRVDTEPDESHDDRGHRRGDKPANDHFGPARKGNCSGDQHHRVDRQTAPADTILVVTDPETNFPAGQRRRRPRNSLAEEKRKYRGRRLSPGSGRHRLWAVEAVRLKASVARGSCGGDRWNPPA